MSDLSGVDWVNAQYAKYKERIRQRHAELRVLNQKNLQSQRSIGRYGNAANIRISAAREKRRLAGIAASEQTALENRERLGPENKSVIVEK